MLKARTLVKATAWILGVSVLVSVVAYICIAIQFQYPGIDWQQQIAGYVLICCVLPALPFVYLLTLFGMARHEAEYAALSAPFIWGVLTWFVWFYIRKRITMRPSEPPPASAAGSRSD